VRARSSFSATHFDALMMFWGVFSMQADEAEVHANDAAPAAAAETETSSPQLGKSAAMSR
jgi:hypothetical protein